MKKLALATIASALALVAPAQAQARCSDTRGSVLAKHTRTICKEATRAARRDYPRNAWRVKVSCKSIERARSSCEWSITVRRGGRWGYTCAGVSEVRGADFIAIDPLPGCKR